MTFTQTEVLLNLNTGETRQNLISTEKAFRFHDGFTRADSDAGWKQVGNLGSGCSQSDIDEFIADAKAIYLKPSANDEGLAPRPPALFAENTDSGSDGVER